MITQIKKRNGETEEFQLEKITRAIFKAAQACGGDDYELAEKIAKRVYRKLNKITESNIIDIETIQDTVEKVLIEGGFAKTAKAYILYREKRRVGRQKTALTGATIDLFNKYIHEQDWQTKENANSSNRSINALNNYTREQFTKLYWLNEVYSTEITSSNENGDMHIHDLGFLGPYCAGWDLKLLLLNGIDAMNITSKPAKHLKSFLGHIMNSFFLTQMETAGAQAFSSFDTFCAPFIYYDKLTYKQVKQYIQEFLFNINMPMRIGAQTPFTNLTFDLQCPKILKDEPVIIGGKYMDKTYCEFQKEMDMINKAFVEVMLEGDGKGRIFTFPIPTINVTREFDWSREVVKDFMKLTTKFGSPYFANYVNSDLSPEDALSMCPLTSDTKVTVKDDKNCKIYDLEIKTIVEEMKKGKQFKVWTKNDWVDAKPVEVPMTEVYKITFENGATVNMGENHLQPVLESRDSLSAKDLIVGLHVPFGILDTTQEFDYLEVNSFVSKYKLTKSIPVSTMYYVKIKNIEKIIVNEEKLYCLEVDSSEHLFMLANGLMTHNCRLRLDTTELRKRGGGLFGSNPLTGSIGVVTINLPRIGYNSKTKEEFFSQLKHVCDIAKNSLEIKRKILELYTDDGLYPFCQFYLKDIKARFGKYWVNHFSTIGIVGMNEALLNFMRKDIGTQEGKDFAIGVMNYLRDLISGYQNETGNLYNLEATPAESTSYRLALKDKEIYSDIITMGTEEVPYYTNSSQLPVNYSDDIFEVLDLQDELQSLYTGGTVLHVYTADHIDNEEVIANFLQKAFSKYKLPYMSYTPTFSICKTHKYFKGEHFTCPTCGEETTVYSRVTGYIRPVQGYHKGKLQEYKDRIKFDVGDIIDENN